MTTGSGRPQAIAAFALAGSLAASTAVPGAERAAQAVKVTVLSTMLADTDGIGEWGFAALIEVDGYRLLFDTGARDETVLRNAEELKVDLASVSDVVLSHNHSDHTGGLLALRRTLASRSPRALSRAHVAPGIFLPRRHEGRRPAEDSRMLAVRDAYEATGAKVLEHAKAGELAPGVWLTGPVARRYPERNWSKGPSLVAAGGRVEEDTIPEDQAVVVQTRGGLVVVTGCGHAGIGNILAQAREMMPGVPVRAVIGGLHLFAADEKSLAWTAERMREAGVQYLLGAHCTGLEAVYRLRALLGLDRRKVVVGAVGSSYSSAAGLDPRLLAH